MLDGVQSNPNNFLADILHFLDGGATQFGNFPKIMEYVLSCRPTMTPGPRQSLKINYTVSMGNFEIFNFTDHQKHFCKFSIFPPSSIDEHFSSQT